MRNIIRKYINGLSDYLRSHVHQEGIIVSEEKKFIYMKPTKTAGSSILRNVLEKQDFHLFHKKDNPREFNNWIKNISDEKLKEYFIFSVVRNPWDRLVSVASYFQKPVKEFLDNLDYYWNDPEIKKHSLPLHNYTHFSGYRFTDVICRFETIQPDINLVFDYIGIERVNLPFVNISNHMHYSYYYNHKNKEKIADLYSKDIALYGYEFEEVNRNKKIKMNGFIKRIFENI